MNPPMEETTVAVASISSRRLFSRFGYYLVCWLLVSIITWVVIQPIDPGEPARTWHPQFPQLAVLISMGIICAVVFTLAQNTINKSRRWYLTLAFAFVVWLLMILV
jgi:hypothetical protein